MLVYITLYILIIILFFSTNKGKNNSFIFLIAVLCICTAGLRDMIGGFDVYIYSELYEQDNLIHTAMLFEPGFVLYYQVLKLINTDRHFMLFISSLLMLGLYGYFLKKMSIAVEISLFIFFCKFYLMSFVYIRQGLAMILVIAALYYYLKNKKLFYISLAILAVFFHKSAIIFLPFLVFGKLKFSNFQIFLGFLVLGILSFTGLGSILFTEIGNVSGEQKIGNYASMSGIINIFYAIEGFIIVVLSFLYRNRFYNTSIFSISIFNGFLFYGFILILGITNATFVRLSWYYFMFICLGLPYFVVLTNQKTVFKNLILIYYSALFFRLMILFDGGDFMPYKSIFQDFDRNGRWEFMEYRY